MKRLRKNDFRKMIDCSLWKRTIEVDRMTPVGRFGFGVESLIVTKVAHCDGIRIERKSALIRERGRPETLSFTTGGSARVSGALVIGQGPVGQPVIVGDDELSSIVPSGFLRMSRAEAERIADEYFAKKGCSFIASAVEFIKEAWRCR